STSQHTRDISMFESFKRCEIASAVGVLSLCSSAANASGKETEDPTPRPPPPGEEETLPLSPSLPGGGGGGVGSSATPKHSTARAPYGQVLNVASSGRIGGTSASSRRRFTPRPRFG